jgi:serine/threonine protein kinase
VYLVRKKGEPVEELYALKQLDKMQIIKHEKVDSVHRERDILMLARNHPNIIHLDCTFSDERNLYYLLEYAENRSLSELLKLISKFIMIIIRDRATSTGAY